MLGLIFPLSVEKTFTRWPKGLFDNTDNLSTYSFKGFAVIVHNYIIDMGVNGWEL